MKRKDFLQQILSAGTLVATGPLQSLASTTHEGAAPNLLSRIAIDLDRTIPILQADVVVAGAGLGGIATSLAALRNGQTVILTEETDWIGGQLTQQAVPPDEHQWIETHGAPASYRQFRKMVRDYYKQHYPLTTDARRREFLNPGDGAVSRLCHEPRVALAVLNSMLAPYISNGRLVLLTGWRAVKADKSGNRILTLEVTNRFDEALHLRAPFFADATELGDLLPITGTAYRKGTESRSETGEMHAPELADPSNNQSFTVCFAMDYVPGRNFVSKPPAEYNFWKNHVPDLKPAWSGRLLDLSYSDPRTLRPKQLGFDPTGKPTGQMLNLWLYRRLIHAGNFEPGFYDGDITLVNWPQNDYMLGDLIDIPRADFDRHVERAGQLSLSLFHWLQTEAPRPDGGKGWPGLRLRPDITGTPTGLAKYPYIRESRRIKAQFTVLEEQVGKDQRAKITGDSNPVAANFYDSVGIGYYHIDLHPSSNKVNYVDFPSLPFQIPLGALLPEKTENLLPANKNIGTTHITNGCYRLHPVEWSIGEAVGCLISYAKKHGLRPAEVRANRQHLRRFQDFLLTQGIELAWPEGN
jgi:hypothetical protein